jgi:hypothetical protein
MRSDQAMLEAVPDMIRFDAMLKATPVEEAGRRILFLEASNEDKDHQNEIVLQKALAESASYFLRHGNIDLSHFTVMGPKSGLSNFLEYEIGRPVDVKVSGATTFVKAELYTGDSPQARNASMVWDSMTKQSPPSRWYPSVGGAVLAKAIKLDAAGAKVAVVTKVRWNNIALDRCPVNMTVGEASITPLGTFTKSLGGFIFGKTLESGYGTDVAALTGGGALRIQSLAGRSKAPHDAAYLKFRDGMADKIRARSIQGMQPASLAQAAMVHFGLSSARAAEYIDRFLSDLKPKGKS